MTKKTVRRAPQHLQPETRKWFRHVVNEWPLEQHHIKLLTIAAETWDRLIAARTVIDCEGFCYENRFGEPRARPEVAIERDCRIAFMRALRELDLDLEPPAAPARPRALPSNRG